MIRTIDECFWGIQNGANIKQSKSSGGFPITRIETIADNKFNRDRVGYAGITDVSSYESYILEDEDLLMSHINSAKYLGRTVLYNRRANEVIIHGMNLLRLRANKEIINPSYAKYLFSGCKFKKQVSRITKKSVNQASFTVGDLKEIKISVPSILEQVQIVEKLDKIAWIIELRQAEIKKAEEIIKARFVEMFGDLRDNGKGWEIKTLDELSYLITDGEHITPRRTTDGIYLLSARNILNHSLRLDDVDYIDQEEYARIAKRVVPKKGDVLISCSGTVGRCCSVPAGIKFQMVRSVALIRFKEEINPVFAEYMITSDYLQAQINGSKTASSQSNLFQGKIRALKGFAPPIELQIQFLQFVQQIAKSKAVIEKSLKELETLQASLMQKYFS